MYRHYRASAGGNLRFNLIHIHTPRAGIGVYQDRHRAGVYGRQGAGNDGKCRHDNFIAGLQPKTSCCHLKGDRAVAHGYAMAPAAITRPFLFKFFNKSACRGNPTSAYAFGNVLQFALPQTRLVHGYHNKTITLIGFYPWIYGLFDRQCPRDDPEG